jgi:hypothetical protein
LHQLGSRRRLIGAYLLSTDCPEVAPATALCSVCSTPDFRLAAFHVAKTRPGKAGTLAKLDRMRMPA